MIGYLQEDLMSTDFDMNASNYWSDTEGSHPGGRGAYLAREWSRAASVVHGLASDRQRPVGSVCGYNRIKLIQVDNDLILVEGALYHILSLSVPLFSGSRVLACVSIIGPLQILCCQVEYIRDLVMFI